MQNSIQPRGATGERGVSLLEALVAILLLGIVLLGVLPSLLQFSDVVGIGEVRSAAVQAALQVNERERRVDPTTLPTSGASAVETVTIGEYDFQVVQRYCQQSAFCIGNARHLTTEVSLNGQQVYGTETVFTRLQ